MKLDIVILGLSITSSWGNGHATTYRGLVRELVRRGHHVLFLERDVPWYADNRDFRSCSCAQIGLYRNLKQLQARFGKRIREADLVILGSYVPDGIFVGEYVIGQASGAVAFYDIDTPVTLAKIKRNECDYLSSELIGQCDLYLSFTGGPTLQLLESRYAAPRARALYCSVDPSVYFPQRRRREWAIGYLGTYSEDRQPGVNHLLDLARTMNDRKFVVAGPQYPDSIRWPKNVERIVHLPPTKHRAFYNQQDFTLNLTRADMKRAGYSPSVRLFEAAACGTPIISDRWEGLGTIFAVGEEILVADSTEELRRIVLSTSDEERFQIGRAARQRVLAEHTAAHRAAELEAHVLHVLAEIKPGRDRSRQFGERGAIGGIMTVSPFEKATT